MVVLSIQIFPVPTTHTSSLLNRILLVQQCCLSIVQATTTCKILLETLCLHFLRVYGGKTLCLHFLRVYGGKTLYLHFLRVYGGKTLCLHFLRVYGGKTLCLHFGKITCFLFFKKTRSYIFAHRWSIA